MSCRNCMYIEHIGLQIDEIRTRVENLEDAVLKMEKQTFVSDEKIKTWSYTIQLIGTVILTTLLNYILKCFTKGG